MTHEQAGELAKILQAYSKGKIIQYYDIEKEKWIDFDYSMESSLSRFIWHGYVFRIKPERKKIALTAKDLFDRAIAMKPMYLSSGEHIQLIESNDVLVGEGSCISYEKLKQDTFINGDPCYKEVDCE